MTERLPVELELLLILSVGAGVLWLIWWSDRRFNLHSPSHQESCQRPDCRHHQIEAERQERIAKEISDAIDRAKFEAAWRNRRRS